MTVDDKSEFGPRGASSSFTGPEALDLARAAINREIAKAETEVARLTAAIRSDAASMVVADVPPAVPHATLPLTRGALDHIELHAARAQVAALKKAWWVVHASVVNEAKARAHLDAWTAKHGEAWSKTGPTEPGWYWTRWGGQSPEPVHVFPSGYVATSAPLGDLVWGPRIPEPQP